MPSARYVLDKAVQYAKDRVVFGRPIGQSQSIQHPPAELWIQQRAAELMVFKAASLYDSGAEVNAAKYLCAEVFFKSAACAVRTHGGMGYAKEFHVERPSAYASPAAGGRGIHYPPCMLSGTTGKGRQTRC